MRHLLSIVVLAFAGIAFLGGSEQVHAEMVLYDNGPIEGGPEGAWSIQFQNVTNSFTLASASSLTEVRLGIWAFDGTVPFSLNWSIGTSPFGSELAAGANSLISNTTYGSFVTDDGELILIYSSSFEINANVGPGSYFLTLSNGIGTGAYTNIYWDINHGPSMAYLDSISIPVNSESFQIIGNVATVPEPSTIALSGLGGIGLAVAGYRRRLAV